MNEPISKPLDIKFRGKTSSSEYNTSEIAKYHDILSLYRASNELLEKMTETNEVAVVENFFLKDKLDRMAQEYRALLTQMSELNIRKSTGQLEKIREAYARDFITRDDGGAKYSGEVEIDRPLASQFATCAYLNNIPKTYQVKDTGEVHVPKDLKVDLYKSDATMSLTHNGFDKMFNGDFTSIWQAKLVDPVAATNVVREQAIQLDIALPTSISQQKKINTVVMYPHPIQGMLIDNVEVYYNGNWTQIPGFHQNDVISQEGVHQWNFADMYAERIRITLRQRSVIDVAGESVYYFGMQHLEVAYRTYSQTPSYAMTKFDMSAEGLYEISGVTHTFLNRGAFSAGTHFDDDLIGSVYEYKLYRRAASGDILELSEKELSETLSFPEIWVKTILKTDVYNGVPPCLQKIQLRYISK